MNKRDAQVDAVHKTYQDDFADFCCTQQKEVVIRPAWQIQAESGPTEQETSDGRSYVADNAAASHRIHNRMERPGRRK